MSDAALSAPLNVTIRELEVNSAVVTWEILEGDPVIGFAITQQVCVSLIFFFFFIFFNAFRREGLKIIFKTNIKTTAGS